MGVYRFILALVVAISHLDLESSNWYQKDIYSFTSLLNLDSSNAVNIFFLVSGFIIALTFSKNYQNTNFIIRSSNFYINRILRIYPLYLLSLILVFLDSYFLNIISLPEDNPFLKYDLFRNIIIIFHEKGSYINSVAWTLDFELRWYLMIPFIFFLKELWNKNIKLNYFIIFIFVTYIFVELFYLYNDKEILDGNYKKVFILGETLFYFIFGYLIFEIFQKVRVYATKKYYFIGLISILVAFVLPITPVIIFYFISIYFCMTINYSNKIDKILGDLSYPVYILHLPAMLPIYLQVNKYFNYLNFGNISSYFFVYSLTIIIFTLFCYIVLTLFQYPIDKIRISFKRKE